MPDQDFRKYRDAAYAVAAGLKFPLAARTKPPDAKPPDAKPPDAKPPDAKPPEEKKPDEQGVE